MREGIKAIGWMFLAAVAYYCIELLFNVIFLYIVRNVGNAGMGADQVIWINLVLKLVVMLVFGFWYMLQERLRHGQVDYRRVLTRKRVWGLLGTGLLGQYSMGFVLIFIRLLMPKAFLEYEKVTEVLLPEGNLPFLTILMVVVIGPIAEELLFRGVIYGGLRRGFTVTQAAVISAAVFGIYHKNIVQGIYAALFGLLLAYVFEKTQTIWGSTIVHMMFNLSPYLMRGLLAALQKSGINLPGLVYFGLYAVGIAAVILCVYSLHKLPGRYEKGKKRMEMSEE